MLPEATHRPLLLRLFSAIQLSEIHYGKVRFCTFKVRYAYNARLKLEKLEDFELHLETDVELYAPSIGVYQSASQTVS